MGLPGQIVYTRTPEAWDEKAWREAGAFAAVFLNYNKFKSIRRAVEATLAQDFSPLEILFMDDASTDGSAEIMEELVRAYRGPHKVLVVRNASNAGICGQWNQVTKFSEAEWFGMFCGDDYAHADRVSSASAIISRYPGLLGLSTSMDAFDVNTGEPCDYAGYPPGVIEMRGNEPPAELYARRWASGCTAFWRRALFQTALPSVPLDDLLIFWHLLMIASGRQEVVWVYDGNFRTIDYSVGAGLWSEIRAVRDPTVPLREWQRRKFSSEVKVYERCRQTWEAILHQAQSCGAAAAFSVLAEQRIREFARRSSLAGIRLRELDMPFPIRFLHKVWRKLGMWCSKGDA